jgi:RNA recognition motif-containing protein
MNIYVGNLPFKASEAELRQSFEAYGKVASVNIITDRETGRPRGFAFVEMPNADEARKAVEGLNGQNFGGRSLTVNEARPREGGGPGGGGGGGRGRGPRG